MCHSFAEWFGNGAQCQRERILDISIWPIWLYFLMWFKGFKGSIWGLDGCLSCWKQRAKVSDTMQAEIWSLGDEMRGMNEMRAIRRMACRMAQPDPQIFGKFQHEDHGVFVPLVLMQLESKCWCKLRRVAARHGWYSEKHWVKTCQDVSRRINDFDRNISIFFCWYHGGIFCREWLRPTLMNIPVVQLSLPELSGQRGAEVARHCLEAVLTCQQCDLNILYSQKAPKSSTKICAGCHNVARITLFFRLIYIDSLRGLTGWFGVMLCVMVTCSFAEMMLGGLCDGHRKPIKTQGFAANAVARYAKECNRYERRRLLRYCRLLAPCTASAFLMMLSSLVCLVSPHKCGPNLPFRGLQPAWKMRK